MMLDRIEVSGFKSIRELKLDLHSLNVLIGANGSGKSNFIALFELLNHVVGGSFQLFVAKGGGAESFLYYGQKSTEEIKISLYFGDNAYRCTLVPTANDTLVFGHEIVFYHDKIFHKPYGRGIGSGHRESELQIKASYSPRNIESVSYTHLTLPTKRIV